MASIEFRITGIGLTGFESGPQNDPASSLGKWTSTSVYTDATPQNTYQAFTQAEMTGPTTKYYGVGIINTSASDLVNARVYVPSFTVPTGVTLSMGMDVGKTLRTNPMNEIADNDTDPGVTFTNISSLTDYANGLKLNGGLDQDLTNLDQIIVWHRMELNAASDWDTGTDFVTLRIANA